MAANIGGSCDVDQLLKKAIKLLHSSHPNSAAELRLMLDEAIKVRYGPEKMLSSTLTARLIEEEANFPGRAVTPLPQPPMAASTSADEIINLTNSPAKTISDSPDTIQDSDDGMSGAGIAVINTAEVDDGNLKEFGDLNCCVCGEMVFTATNRLIECSKCGTLYHQECHKPPITEEEASEDHEHSWQCDTCTNKPSTSKAAGLVSMQVDEPIPLVSKAKSSVASSRSSTSSNSSSPFYKPEHSTSTTGNSSGSSSKHGHKSSSSSSTKSHKEDRQSSNKPSVSTTTAINVISTTEKHTTTGIATSSSSSKRSHSGKSSSKTSSSKHHESSSSSSGKRRSNK